VSSRLALGERVKRDRAHSAQSVACLAQDLVGTAATVGIGIQIVIATERIVRNAVCCQALLG
jgi:hypothetical protein